MDGLTKETYEKVRVKGKFEVVRGNIERFLDLKHELGSPIEADIQIVRLSETDAEVEEFVKRWKASHADLINIKELDTWGGQIDEVSSLAVEEGPDDATRPQAVPEPLVPRHIHWDGVLVSCSRDYDAITPLGNVKTAACSRPGTARACSRCAAGTRPGTSVPRSASTAPSGRGGPRTVRRRRHRRQDREGAHRGVDARGARGAQAVARPEQRVASVTTPDAA